MAEGTKNLYNPHQGLTGRDGGPYLDEEEARLAEIRRAKVEGREPDLDNPPATAGIPLVTAGQLVSQALGVNSNPSQASYDPGAHAVELLAKNESFPVNPHSSRELTQDEKDALKAESENPVTSNPASSVVASKDPEAFDAKKTTTKK